MSEINNTGKAYKWRITNEKYIYIIDELREEDGGAPFYIMRVQKRAHI